MQLIKYKKYSFSVIILHLVLIITGIALIPLLHINFLPENRNPTIMVSFTMYGANPVVTDNEVTSKLEGVFSGIKGIEKIRSQTGNGFGRITLEIEKNTDIDALRFEVSSKIRQIYPSLPSTVSYPQIFFNRPDDENKVESMLIYTINGPGLKSEIEYYVQQNILPVLSGIKGIYKIELSGATPMQWELEYNKMQLDNIGLSREDISRQINSYYKNINIGRTLDKDGLDNVNIIPVVYNSRDESEVNWGKIKITKNNRIFNLTDLVEIKRKEAPPKSYYRINGLNTININILAVKNSNYLVVGGMVKEKIKLAEKKLPKGYNITKSYDNTTYIKTELKKISLRIIFSLFILLFLIWIIYLDPRYLLMVFLSIIANIVIAFIFYHVLKVEIHLYSLAGITISLGIIIDNTIVMADHLRIGKGTAIFRAIFAATLTTISTLLIIFFLSEEYIYHLYDFALVIIINLGVSLLIALFFIPSLMDKMPLSTPVRKITFKKYRKKVYLVSHYKKIVQFCIRYRILILITGLLIFGLPVFMLPTKLHKKNLNSKKWPYELYNNTLGSYFYQRHLKKYIDMTLGGTLRLFLEDVKHAPFGSSSRQTVLRIESSMDEGSTLEQTNEVFKSIEKFLLQVKEIDQFHTRIYSPSYASIQIYFKKEHEFGRFPEFLKSKIENMVINIGGADWKISGIGRGFNNALNNDKKNSRIVLYGYNFETLKGYAKKLVKYLSEVQRVESSSIYMNGKATEDNDVHKEYHLDLDKEHLKYRNVHLGNVISELRKSSNDEYHVITLYPEGREELVYLKEENFSIMDMWGFYNKPMKINDNETIKMFNVANIYKERERNLINKVDMQYQMVVEFNFIGSWSQKKSILGKIEQKISQELPIGYQLKQQFWDNGLWRDKKKNDNKIWLLLVIIAIIFFICAIVFESLMQSVAVILMIPISFIGVFLTFYMFDLDFGQGGYAALLLLCGLTVNSALYILNDLNNVRVQFPGMSPMKQYLKAFNQKIIPVFVTIISTALGLVPFLFGNSKEKFWLSMTAGTIGGLLFSLLAILIFLPLFVKGLRKE